MASAISKYLENYAEAMALSEHLQLAGPWSSVICVPAKAESQTLNGFIQRLSALHSQKKFLCLLNLNCSLNDSPETIQDTMKCLDLVKQHFPSKKHRDDQTLLSHDKFDLVLIDRCTPAYRFTDQGGVGRARKLICDLAAKLWHAGKIENPWIFSTDADALLPPDYLSIATGLLHAEGCMVFDFEHLVDGLEQPEEKQALCLYENYLRYYREGLFYAGSPYAFYTIGSLISIHVSTYCQVRGFPQREAGEDFYLLNKAAKVAPVYSLAQKIKLQGRVSSRVPFGTGPATKAWAKKIRSNESINWYHPQVFECLKDLYEAAQLAATNEKLSSLKKYQEWLPPQFLEKLGNSWRQNKSAEKRLQAFWNQMDSFACLRFIHKLSEHRLPRVPWQQVVELNSFFRPSDELEKFSKRGYAAA